MKAARAAMVLLRRAQQRFRINFGNGQVHDVKSRAEGERILVDPQWDCGASALLEFRDQDTGDWFPARHLDRQRRGAVRVTAQQAQAAPAQAQPPAQAAPAGQPASPAQAAQPGLPASPAQPAPGTPKPPSPEQLAKEQDKVREESRTRQLWVGVEECLQGMEVNDLTTLADAIASDPDLLANIVGETLAAKTREAPSLARELDQAASHVRPARRALATLMKGISR